MDNTIAKNKILSDLQKIKLENTKMDVSKDILIQYSDIQMFIDLHALWNGKIESLKQQKEIAQLLVNKGRKTQAIVWEIEVEIGRSNQNVEDILYRKEVALLKLKNLMALPLQSVIQISTSNNLTVMIDSIGYSDNQLDDITINTPAYRESVSQTAIAHKDLKLARSLYYPTFTLNGMLGTSYSSVIINNAYLADNKFNNQVLNNSYQNVSLNIYI